jgi:hypothetical protein
MVVVLVLIALLLGACGGGPWGGGPGQQDGVPSSISLHNPKGLFIGSTSSPAASTYPRNADIHFDAAGSLVDALFEVLANGDIQQVSFLDENGLEVTLEIDRLFRLSADYIGIAFTLDENQYQVVAELASGALFDFSAYDLQSAMMRDGLLYALSSQTIYRIDFSTRTATAMNNPAYDPAGCALIGGGGPYPKYPFIVVNDGNVISVDQVGHLLIFFGDNTTPKDTWCGNEIWGPGGNYPLGLVLGENGFLYRLDYVYSGTPKGTMITRLDFTHDGLDPAVVVCDDSGSGFYLVGNGYGLYDRNRYVMFSNGYQAITTGATGDFQMNFTAKSIPAISTDSFISGTHIYSLSGDTLNDLDFGVEDAFHARFTHPDIIAWNVVANQVVFSAYISGTSIGTYQADPDGNVTLLETSDMAVRDIVELTF